MKNKITYRKVGNKDRLEQRLAGDKLQAEALAQEKKLFNKLVFWLHMAVLVPMFANDILKNISEVLSYQERTAIWAAQRVKEADAEINEQRALRNHFNTRFKALIEQAGDLEALSPELKKKIEKTIKKVAAEEAKRAKIKESQSHEKERYYAQLQNDLQSEDGPPDITDAFLNIEKFEDGYTDEEYESSRFKWKAMLEQHRLETKNMNDIQFLNWAVNTFSPAVAVDTEKGSIIESIAHNFDSEHTVCNVYVRLMAMAIIELRPQLKNAVLFQLFKDHTRLVVYADKQWIVLDALGLRYYSDPLTVNYSNKLISVMDYLRVTAGLEPKKITLNPGKLDNKPAFPAISGGSFSKFANLSNELAYTGSAEGYYADKVVLRTDHSKTKINQEGWLILSHQTITKAHIQDALVKAEKYSATRKTFQGFYFGPNVKKFEAGAIEELCKYVEKKSGDIEFSGPKKWAIQDLKTIAKAKLQTITFSRFPELTAEEFEAVYIDGRNSYEFHDILNFDQTFGKFLGKYLPAQPLPVQVNQEFEVDLTNFNLPATSQKNGIRNELGFVNLLQFSNKSAKLLSQLKDVRKLTLTDPKFPPVDLSPLAKDFKGTLEIRLNEAPEATISSLGSEFGLLTVGFQKTISAEALRSLATKKGKYLSISYSGQDVDPTATFNPPTTAIENIDLVLYSSSNQTPSHLRQFIKTFQAYPGSLVISNYLGNNSFYSDRNPLFNDFQASTLNVTHLNEELDFLSSVGNYRGKIYISLSDGDVPGLSKSTYKKLLQEKLLSFRDKQIEFSFFGANTDNNYFADLLENLAQTNSTLKIEITLYKDKNVDKIIALKGKYPNLIIKTDS